MQTKGISWQVPTGRRDGRVSVASDASILPGPSATIESQTRLFTNKGLNTQDLVVLVGKIVNHLLNHYYYTIIYN